MSNDRSLWGDILRPVTWGPKVDAAYEAEMQRITEDAVERARLFADEFEGQMFLRTHYPHVFERARSEAQRRLREINDPNSTPTQENQS